MTECFRQIGLRFLSFHIPKYSGLPLGQEIRKSQEKFKKNDKSQEKMGGFEKKSGNSIKLKKKSDFVSLNVQNSLFSKAFKW